MTATAQPQSKPSSRRALLAGALGGLAAIAASALGRLDPVRAGVDGDVVLAGDNTTAGTTGISNYTTNADVLVVAGHGSGMGIAAASQTSYGVFGNSDTFVGIEGFSTATDQPAIRGYAAGASTGVQGYSGLGSPPAGKAKTGVYGYAVQDSSSKGVWGQTTSGHAIHGTATGGYAGYFEGKVFTTKFHELPEISLPAAPAVNQLRLFARDNGSGKTQLWCRR